MHIFIVIPQNPRLFIQNVHLQVLLFQTNLSIQQYTLSYTSLQGRTKGTRKREETFFILSSGSVELAEAEKNSKHTAGSSPLPSRNQESPRKALSRQHAHQTANKDLYHENIFFNVCLRLGVLSISKVI